MQSYGSDRLRRGEGEQLLLSCRVPKEGWKGRIEKTLTSAEHPGTAVQWDDAVYEVVDVDLLPNGGICYTLEPWRDSHAMRVVDVYDGASEGRRTADRRDVAWRVRKRRWVVGLGFIYGHFPAVVQEHLGHELGIRTPRLTMASTIPVWLFWVIAIQLHVGAKLEMEGSPIPFGVWFLLGALALESVVRAYVALMQNRPMGSLFGALGYTFFYYLAPGRANRVSPFAFERGTSVPITDPDEEIALRDALKMREPFITLLPPPEQEYLARRFGYDYRQHAPKMAWALLFFAACGVVTSLATLEQQKTFSALLSLITAAIVAVEQIVRLNAFSRGPAGSILGFFVRPFVRKLLA